MNHAEKLSAIEDKIRELIPRLKELSFGCRISDGSRAELVFTNFTGTDKENIEFSQIECFSGSYGMESIGDFEIIGHPIRLEDVLEALTKHGTDKSYACTDMGHIIVSNTNEWTGVVWYFGKPLSEQSEVSINFLYDLFFDKQ